MDKKEIKELDNEQMEAVSGGYDQVVPILAPTNTGGNGDSDGGFKDILKTLV